MKVEKARVQARFRDLQIIGNEVRIRFKQKGSGFLDDVVQDVIALTEHPGEDAPESGKRSPVRLVLPPDADYVKIRIRTRASGKLSPRSER